MKSSTGLELDVSYDESNNVQSDDAEQTRSDITETPPLHDNGILPESLHDITTPFKNNTSEGLKIDKIHVHGGGGGFLNIVLSLVICFSQSIVSILCTAV